MTKTEALNFFWSRIEVGGLDECWEWTGHVSKYGYGTYNGLYDFLGTTRCSRQMFILTRGEVPVNQVLHSCDNRRCCNPMHLREGTHLENMEDMVQRGRVAHQGTPQPGSRNGSSVLTEEQVSRILRDPRTLKLIALDYNVSKSRAVSLKLMSETSGLIRLRLPANPQ